MAILTQRTIWIGLKPFEMIFEPRDNNDEKAFKLAILKI